MITFEEMKYKGFTIRYSRVGKDYYAFNKITGNRRNGSSRTFTGKSLSEIKRRINRK
jgi:hypothetical protein